MVGQVLALRASTGRLAPADGGARAARKERRVCGRTLMAVAGRAFVVTVVVAKDAAG